MELFKVAIECPQCIISVMGDHAGESVAVIFERKIADVTRVGKTFWLIKSPEAQPFQVQAMSGIIPIYVLFIAPTTKGGSRPTIAQDAAKEYSENRVAWHHFPDGMSPVTGKLDARATVLVFDKLSTCNGTLDLWNYANLADTQKPVKFILGCSTICTVRKDMGFHPARLKSRHRQVLAVGRLALPYCVWVR